MWKADLNHSLYNNRGHVLRGLNVKKILRLIKTNEKYYKRTDFIEMENKNHARIYL